MQYEDALRTLASLGPELRTGSTGQPRKFSLEHIRTLLVELGEPQRSFRSVLIAGTNGKGSTAATVASVSAAAALRTGLYTSPHLLRVNERIRVCRTAVSGAAQLVEISDEDFGRLFGRAYEASQTLIKQERLPHMPSFFELLTATGLLHFAEQGVELAILEVGLGGRLDATNVVEPIVSVITDIGIDHTEFLGNTITEIAREKAGILRRDGVLVTLSQHQDANAAIGEIALALGVRGVDAARFLPPRGFAGESEAARRGMRSSSDPQAIPVFNRNELEGPAPVSDASATTVTPAPPEQSSPLGHNRYPVVIDGELVELDSPLAGQHQQRNLALAVATAVELRSHHGFAISNRAIEAGVRATSWPGRLEWIAPGSQSAARPQDGRPHAPLLLDVAHNPAGAWTLRAALAQLPESRPRTLIFSCLADKQIDEMARILLPLFDATSGDPARRRDHIVFAPIANPRAATVEQLLAAAHRLEIPAHAAPHLPAALQQAHALTPLEGVIVATGSVYLIGELRAMALAQSVAESST